MVTNKESSVWTLLSVFAATWRLFINDYLVISGCKLHTDCPWNQTDNHWRRMFFLNRCWVTESLNCWCAESPILENHRQNVVTVTSITKYPNSFSVLSMKIVFSDCFFFCQILVTVKRDLFLSTQQYFVPLLLEQSVQPLGCRRKFENPSSIWGKTGWSAVEWGKRSYTLVTHLLSFILASFAAHWPL